jgi:hypothetical protein
VKAGGKEGGVVYGVVNILAAEIRLEPRWIGSLLLCLLHIKKKAVYLS